MDTVSHFEIPVENSNRAVEFYKNTFGWEIQAFPEMQYWIIRTCECDENNMPKEPGVINGGFFQRNETGKHPMVVVSVDSIDECSKKIEEADGKIVQQKVQVGEMGFYARFEDTEGNVVGLWEAIKKE